MGNKRIRRRTQHSRGAVQIFSSRYAFSSAIASTLAAACLATVLAVPAHAALPSSSGFGPAIESPDYDGQSKCSPDAKPGTLAFQRILYNEFPSIGYGSISRACSIGGQSEHKEGRALDWPVNAAYPSHRAIAKRVIEWLLAPDRYGNEAAMAKRLGIMYLIWNRRIWGSWGGWDTYCVQKPRGCVDPEDKDLRSPHTDHIHFSMSRAGAQMKTTYWIPERSMMAAIAAHPGYGYWQLGRNGGVSPFGTGWYGSKSDGYLKKSATAMASTPSGYGYWLVTKSGRVYAFGDALHKGQIRDGGLAIVDIEPTPTGNGYWLVSRSGRALPFGDAEFLGSARGSGAEIVGLASTTTGLGYWLFAAGGNVFAFGDAQDHGDLGDEALQTPIIGGDNAGDTGYWLATAGGRVASFGAAPNLGGASDLGSAVVGIAANPSATGYWLLTEKGRLVTFGDAAALGSLGD